MAKNTSTQTQSDQEKRVAAAKARAERFRSLIVKRMNRALKSLDAVAALSNRASYAYEAEHVTKIVTALESRVAGVKKRYESGATSSDSFAL